MRKWISLSLTVVALASCAPPPDEISRSNNPFFEEDAGSSQYTPLPDSGPQQMMMYVPDSGPAPITADAGIAGGTDAAEQPRPGVDLGGIWALKLTIAQIVELPTQDPTPSVITILARLDSTHTGNTVTLRSDFCDLDIESQSALQILFPQRAVDAFPDIQLVAQLAAAEIGAAVEAPPVVQLAGWESQTPATDPLPTAGNDTRVRDMDGDGDPGITVRVTGTLINSDVSIVNRAIVTFRGSIVSADRVEGLSTTVAEQSIVGADSILIPRGRLDSQPDPDPNKSRFQIVRLGAANACSDIVAGAATLFR